MAFVINVWKFAHMALLVEQQGESVLGVLKIVLIIISICVKVMQVYQLLILNQWLNI